MYTPELETKLLTHLTEQAKLCYTRRMDIVMTSDTAQLTFICETGSAFHVHEGLVSLCSLKGTTGEDFNAESKQDASSELAWERPKHTTSDDGQNRSHTHMLRQ